MLPDGAPTGRWTHATSAAACAANGGGGGAVLRLPQAPPGLHLVRSTAGDLRLLWPAYWSNAHTAQAGPGRRFRFFTPEMRAQPASPGHLMALGATVLWGFAFIAMRQALDHLAPHALVWMRNLIGAGFLFVLLATQRMPVVPHREDRWTILAMGLIFGIHLWLQALALETTSTMRAGWIIAFIPAVVAVGAWAFKGRHLRAGGWAGIGLASIGVLVLTAMRPSHLVHAATGDLLMLASTFTWAAYNLLGMAALQRNGPLRVTAWALLASTAPNLLMSIGTPVWTAAPDAGALGALLFLGIGASGMALWLFAAAVAALGPERAAAFQYLQPFVTMIAAWGVLHERLTPAILLAGPMVLGGVWLVQRSARSERTE